MRTQGDPHALIRPLVDALTSADPTVKPSVSLAADGFRRDLEEPRMLMALSSGVAAAALALATIGLFAVTAFLVEHRTHEIGIRRALGATTADLLALFLRETLGPVGVGICCGIALALLGGGVVQGVLSGVSGRDPLALCTAVLVLLITAAVAVLIPAHRGSGWIPRNCSRGCRRPELA